MFLVDGDDALHINHLNWFAEDKIFCAWHKSNEKTFQSASIFNVDISRNSITTMCDQEGEYMQTGAFEGDPWTSSVLVGLPAGG